MTRADGFFPGTVDLAGATNKDGAGVRRGERSSLEGRVKRVDSPQIFRVLLPASDLERSRQFYEALFAARGRPVGGGRVDFDCGPVILGILDYSTTPERERSSPAEALYFATHGVEGIHRRASALSCLSPELIHGDPNNPAGEVVVRPWGERSFYVKDPSGNPLCFVDAETLFTGTPAQVTNLRRAVPPRPKRRRARRSPRSNPHRSRRAAR